MLPKSPRARRLLGAAVLMFIAAWPAQAQQSRACMQFEAQLAALDRSGGDPARLDQIRRYEDAANKQQFELDRARSQSRQAGCEGMGFFLFGNQPAQCGSLNTRIQQMRANLDRIQSDLARLQSGSGPERESQRRSILAALADHDCGPQYRDAAAPRGGGLFGALFGSRSIFRPEETTPNQAGTYRTVCVRLCDGFYFPISFSTVPSRFRDDEQVCHRSCPAAQVALYAYPNPGGDIQQAQSIEGHLYTELPAAFRYRQAIDPACGCRRSGETWAQALQHLDNTGVERGDIVVTDERARQLSQPRFDAQGKRMPTLRGGQPDTRTPNETPEPVAGQKPGPTVKPDPNRTVRSVGPTFLPER